jgi:diguanylate cyclase (GGDEF)-like protein
MRSGRLKMKGLPNRAENRDQRKSIAKLAPMPNSVTGEPLLASDVVGLALGLFALTFALLWLRDRDPGMGWFACCWALLGAWFKATAYQSAGSAFAVYTPWVFVVIASGVCLSVGLVAYLRVPAALRMRAWWITLTPLALGLAMDLYVGITGARVARSLDDLPVGAWYLALGLMPWMAGAREPGAGHRFVALTLWSVPVLTIALAALRIDTVNLRFYAIFPLIVLALTLVTATLLRRRRALEDEVERRKAAETDIQRLAYFDDLTGLPNRRLLLDRLGQSLVTAGRSGQFGALLFLDLDNFKHLNDARGHALGDRLLVDVARRVTLALRNGDTVARLGGDEFVGIVNNLGEEITAATNAAISVAEKVRSVLEGAHEIDGHRYSGTGTIGLTMFPKPGDGVDSLLREADTAMYRAKTGGRNRIAFFEPTMQSAAEERLALEQDLKLAIEHDQIRIYGQPQFRADGTEAGCELLLRWSHERRGAVSPANFIPIAEESGLILRLGDLVLRRACEILARMDAAGCLVPISVNISPRQFHQDDFIGSIRTMLLETHAPGSHLIFEVTEGLFIDNWQKVAERMLELSGLGIQFSIDDFGTGYSSLAYLKKLPLHEIKIDKQFVQNMPVDPNDRAIVVSIIALARSYHLRVIAEGVETAAQAQILAQEGCDGFQGYLYAVPMPIEAWLDGRLQSANRPSTAAAVALQP